MRLPGLEGADDDCDHINAGFVKAAAERFLAAVRSAVEECFSIPGLVAEALEGCRTEGIANVASEGVFRRFVFTTLLPMM